MSRIRFMPVVLCVIALIVPGGCIFDSGGDSDSGTYEITGHVSDEEHRPISDVKIKAYFGYDVGGPSTLAGSTSTDCRGYYRIPFDQSVHQLLLAPSKPTCVFRPPVISYFEPGRSLYDQDFTGYCGETYRIDGHVRDEAGEPVGGVAMMVRDEHDLWNKSVFTSVEGYYFIEDLVPDLTYVVTPGRASYYFEPAQRTYPDLSQSFTDQDYVAVPNSARELGPREHALTLE